MSKYREQIRRKDFALKVKDEMLQAANKREMKAVDHAHQMRQKILRELKEEKKEKANTVSVVKSAILGKRRKTSFSEMLPVIPDELAKRVKVNESAPDASLEPIDVDLDWMNTPTNKEDDIDEPLPIDIENIDFLRSYLDKSKNRITLYRMCIKHF